MSRQITDNLEANSTEAATGLLRPLAPEDLEPAQFITVLDAVYDIPRAFLECGCDWHRMTENITFRLRSELGGHVFRVLSVCLPYLQVENSYGNMVVFDTRRLLLARVNQQYAKSAWDQHKRVRKQTRRHHKQKSGQR